MFTQNHFLIPQRLLKTVLMYLCIIGKLLIGVNHNIPIFSILFYHYIWNHNLLFFVKTSQGLVIEKSLNVVKST